MRQAARSPVSKRYRNTTDPCKHRGSSDETLGDFAVRDRLVPSPCELVACRIGPIVLPSNRELARGHREADPNRLSTGAPDRECIADGSCTHCDHWPGMRGAREADDRTRRAKRLCYHFVDYAFTFGLD